MSFRLLITLALSVAVLACPSPPSEPTPPVPSPSPLAAGMLLHVDDQGRFALSSGAPVRLQGVGGVCCTEDPVNLAKEKGWPLVTIPAIEELARAKGNFIHIRLGPHVRANEGEGFSGYAEMVDGRYDLSRWDVGFWQRVRALLESAAALGVYVEVDVVDGWVVRTEEHSPWTPRWNALGENIAGCARVRVAPHPRHLEWITKVVEETGSFENVLYQISNESGVCKVEPVWELGVAQQIRTVEAARGFPRHPIGTNSERADLEHSFDYIERHGSEAQDPEDRPVMVNEYTVDNLTPEQFAIEMEAAVRRGTAFHLWMGQQHQEEWRRSLSFIKASMEGRGVQVPTSCPAWVRLKAGVFSILAPDHATFISEPVPDGFLRLDSTPFFDDGQGGFGKCNTEGDVCGGRKCEDPRGLRWSQLEGPEVSWSVSNPGPENGYSVNIGGIARRGGIPLSRGHYVFEGCPLPNAHDGEVPPSPLDVRTGCARVRFNVN